jgi:hypothetical protein
MFVYLIELEAAEALEGHIVGWPPTYHAYCVCDSAAHSPQKRNL